MQKWLEDNQQQISRQIRHNKLPHALLLSGVKGSGYEELASWLINVLLCQQCHREPTQKKTDNLEHTNSILKPCGQCKRCKLFVSGNYPDHLTLSTDKTTIGVDEVRNLSRFFEKTAHIGKVKTALVIQADRMTSAAANALLKTLEEPTSNSYIILTTDRAETFLPTIISRCQQVEIRPPVGEKLIAAFAAKDSQQQNQSLQDHNNKQKMDTFINLSHNSELLDSDIAEAFELFRKHIKQYLYYQQGRKDLLKVLIDDDNAMRWLERSIVDLMREQWSWQPCEIHEEDNSKGMLNKEQLWQIYHLIKKANIKLKTLVQVNRQFLSEKLLVDITSIINMTKI